MAISQNSIYSETFSGEPAGWENLTFGDVLGEPRVVVGNGGKSKMALTPISADLRMARNDQKV